MQIHTTPEAVRPGREEDAHQIAAAAHAWLDRFNGRAVRLQRAHVFEICRILLRAGVQPTVEAIRQVNGSVGSPNVIHPELKAYFRLRELVPAGSEAARRSEDDFPPELYDLWRVLTRQARSGVGKEFEEREATLADGQARLAAAEADLLERTRLLEERNIGREQLVAQLHADIQMARAEAHDARDASAERLRVLKLAQVDLERLRTETEQLRADLVHRTEQTAEARGALAVANTQLAAAAQQVDQQTRLVAAAEARAAQLRDDLAAATQRGDRLAVEAAAAKVQIAELGNRANSHEERANQALSSAATTATQLAALQDEHRGLQASHAIAVRDAQQHAIAYTQLRGAHKEVEAVRTHLVQMTQERDAAARDRDNLLRHPPALVQRLGEIEALLRRILGDASA